MIYIVKPKDSWLLLDNIFPDNFLDLVTCYSIYPKYYKLIALFIKYLFE